MVTSPHRLASEAGRKVLNAGGNAMEAAIAIGATIAVTYPHFATIGGDAVWIIADKDGSAKALLGIGQAPRRLPAFDDPTLPLRGAGAVLTTACLVDSWHRGYEFSRNSWSGKASWASLLEDAIGFAKDGFPVTASQHFWQHFRKDELERWPGFRRTFMPDGAIPEVGAAFRQPELAKSLELLARNGARDFYEGALAERIVEGLRALNAPIDKADLAATEALDVQPLAVPYREGSVLGPPPPTQGVSTLEIMGILQSALDPKSVALGSADYYHMLVEAVKRAFLDRPKIADPAFVDVPVAEWLSPQRLAAQAATIDLARALPWPHVANRADTVFFGAVDKDGRCVAALESTYYDWGSGIVVGDTGIIWQNRGASFSLDTRSPNVIAPGKRPFHTLNPGIYLKAGRPHIVYGTQGADGQPQTLTVVLTGIIDYGLDPLAALTLPRFLLGRTFSDNRDTLKLEQNAGETVFAELARRSHELSPIPARSPLGGQAGAIVIEAGVLEGAHDPRSDGCALGT
jgi:gamma-glutamyltranspeptidase/glutathione hydrolase